jgi:ribonuclease P protein subunit RPR2
MRSNAKQIARQRIQVLFQQAKKVYRDNPQLSSRYVETARKIAMAAKIRLPTMHRRQICKNCNMLLVQGDNCRVRIKQKREPHIVITCLNCGHKTRILLRKKKEKIKLEQDNYSNETPR